ncbi:hypothetical protein [Priestia aryabhattai]
MNEVTSNLMNGYVLDDNNELTVSRKNKGDKTEVEAPIKTMFNFSNPIDRLAKRSRQVGHNNRNYNSSKYRNELSRTTSDRRKELLESAELSLSINNNSGDEIADFKLDSKEDTRVNRYHRKSGNEQASIKNFLSELLTSKKKH